MFDSILVVLVGKSNMLCTLRSSGRGLELLVALVHGLILRLQALLLPFQNLVFSGH